MLQKIIEMALPFSQTAGWLAPVLDRLKCGNYTPIGTYAGSHACSDLARELKVRLQNAKVGDLKILGIEEVISNLHNRNPDEEIMNYGFSGEKDTVIFYWDRGNDLVGVVLVEKLSQVNNLR